MATTFVKNGTNVLVTIGGNDPISAPGNAFISPHPSEEDVIMISEKFNPQARDEAIKIFVSDVTLPVNSGRSDLIVKLSTDFFFRVAAGESEEATDSFYTESEVDALHAIGLQTKYQNDIFKISGVDYEFPVGATSLNSATGVLVDGTMYMVTYNITKARTITGVDFNVATTQASFTADNFNGFSFCSVNKATGELTELTRTANDGNIWKGALNTKCSANFLAAQNIQPGIYAVLFVYNSSAQTTAPTLGTCGTAYSSFHLFNNNVRISALKATQTDLPATVNMSTFSIQSTIHGILLR